MLLFVICVVYTMFECLFCWLEWCLLAVGFGCCLYLVVGAGLCLLVWR